MENKKKKFLIFSLIATFIALFIHAYLSIKYYNLNFGMAQGQSSCNINSLFNCDATSASTYAQVFGIPVAMWGLATNLVLLALTLIAWLRFAERPERAHRFAVLLSLAILLTSVVMGSISTFKLGTFCLYCVFAYVLSLFSFIGLWFSRPSDSSTSWSRELIEAVAIDKWIYGFLIAAPVLAYMFHSMVLSSFGFKNFERTVQEATYLWSTASIYTFDLNTGLVLKPELKNPKMVIVEFADFLCPHCKHASPTLHAFAESHPDVQLIFKPFPLDGSCNPDPGMKGTGDGVRCRLSLATLCAESTEKKGWLTHNYIFDHQQDFFGINKTEEVDRMVCEGTGLSCTPLKECMDSADALLNLKKLAQEGLQAQIRGTPAIFANGKALMAGQTIPVLESTYKLIK